MDVSSKNDSGSAAFQQTGLNVNTKPSPHAGPKPSENNVGRLLQHEYITIKKCRHGLMMYNKNDLFVGRSLDIYGEWAEPDLALISQFVSPGDVVLDVGANIGAHTVALAKMIGNRSGGVYSFEPQRLVFQMLCANVALNALQKVMCFPNGLGHENTVLKVPSLNPNAKCNFGGVSLEGVKDGDSVRVTTIDSFNFPKVDLIKIDVEGMEARVLEGGRKTIAANKPVLFVENNDEEKSAEIIESLLSLGYRCWWHINRFYNPNNHFGVKKDYFSAYGPEANLLCFHQERQVNFVGDLLPVEGPGDTRLKAIARHKARRFFVHSEGPAAHLLELRTPPEAREEAPAPVPAPAVVSTAAPDPAPAALAKPSPEELAEALEGRHDSSALAAFHLQAGRVEEAGRLYGRILSEQPDNHQALHGMAKVLFQLGKNEAAYKLLVRICSIRPDDHEAHMDLSEVLFAAGDFQKAEVAARKALTIDPGHAGGHLQLAKILSESDRVDEALNVLRLAVRLDPCNGTIRNIYRRGVNRLVPAWHFQMLNDRTRNQVFEQALVRGVRPDDLLLEIGTGSGLLAMFAARAGVRKIFTCEMVRTLAYAAQDIIATNGFSGRIQVIPKKSTDLVLGADLPRRADVLMMEIFSSELLAEDVIPTIEDAKRRLLEPGARIIPAQVAVRGRLVGGEELFRSLSVETVSGFDLSPFNEFMPAKYVIDHPDLNYLSLSDDFDVFYFDFNNQNAFPAETIKIQVTASGSGPCLGVLQWIRLQFDQDLIYENRPGPTHPSSHWQPVLYTFPEPVNLSEGQMVILKAAHNRQHVQVGLDRVLEPGEEGLARHIVRAA